MGDRRQGDRREPEKGVLKIKFKDAVIYVLIAFILILSLSINVALSITNRKLKNIIAEYESGEIIEEEYNDENEDSTYEEDEVSENITENVNENAIEE